MDKFAKGDTKLPPEEVKRLDDIETQGRAKKRKSGHTQPLAPPKFRNFGGDWCLTNSMQPEQLSSQTQSLGKVMCSALKFPRGMARVP